MALFRRTQEGNMRVYRDSLLFRAGDYKDKDFSLSAARLRAVVQTFSAPVPVNLEHAPAMLKGKLGEIRRIWIDEKNPDVLRAEVAIPEWLDEQLEPEERKLSAEFDRGTFKLLGAALTTAPRVSDAALMAAFKESDIPKPFIDVKAIYDRLNNRYYRKTVTDERIVMMNMKGPLTIDEAKALYQSGEVKDTGILDAISRTDWSAFSGGKFADGQPVNEFRAFAAGITKWIKATEKHVAELEKMPAPSDVASEEDLLMHQDRATAIGLKLQEEGQAIRGVNGFHGLTQGGGMLGVMTAPLSILTSVHEAAWNLARAYDAEHTRRKTERETAEQEAAEKTQRAERFRIWREGLPAALAAMERGEIVPGYESLFPSMLSMPLPGEEPLFTPSDAPVDAQESTGEAAVPLDEEVPAEVPAQPERDLNTEWLMGHR
jgi:hypothetical protein